MGQAEEMPELRKKNITRENFYSKEVNNGKKKVLIFDALIYGL